MLWFIQRLPEVLDGIINPAPPCQAARLAYIPLRQVALKQRGIDKLVEEAREDNRENDASHMGKQ